MTPIDSVSPRLKFTKIILCHTHSSLSPETVKQQLDQTGSHQRQEESFNSSVSTAPARSKPKSEGTRSVPKSGSRASPDQARTVSLWMFPCISVSSSSSQPFPKRLHCEASPGSSHTPWLCPSHPSLVLMSYQAMETPASLGAVFLISPCPFQRLLISPCISQLTFAKQLLCPQVALAIKWETCFIIAEQSRYRAESCCWHVTMGQIIINTINVF